MKKKGKSNLTIQFYVVQVFTRLHGLICHMICKINQITHHNISLQLEYTFYNIIDTNMIQKRTIKIMKNFKH
jgi:hypothetical protein